MFAGGESLLPIVAVATLHLVKHGAVVACCQRHWMSWREATNHRRTSQTLRLLRWLRRQPPKLYTSRLYPIPTISN